LTIRHLGSFARSWIIAEGYGIWHCTQNCGQAKGFRLTNWTFANGVKDTVTYGDPQDPRQKKADLEKGRQGPIRKMVVKEIKESTKSTV
jgi:hypothetical protein